MVPNGWMESSLLEVLEKIIDYRGQSVPKADFGIPLITARNVRFGYLDFSSQEYIDDESYKDWMTRGIPQSGDILFTTEAPLGMVCRYPAKGTYAIGQRTVTLRTNKKLDSEFLLYTLLSEHGQRIIDIRSSGSTAKGIKSSELKKIKITYPPSVKEQCKIAKILSTWDKAISTTEALIDNSKQQKKALMQQLLTGKKRFAGFVGEVNQGGLEKSHRMRLISKGNTPVDWNSKKIREYVINHKGGAPLKPADFCEKGFPVIPKKAIQPGNELIIINPTYCTTEFAEKNTRSIVDNDYTITTLRDLVPTGPTIGTVVNFYTDNKYILSQGVYGLKLTDKIDRNYFAYLSNTSFYRNVMRRVMVGSTQVHIRTPEYLNVEIQTPPLPEQKKIASVLTNAAQEIELLEQQLADLKQEKKALMQQLLTGKRRVIVDIKSNVLC